MNRQWRLNHSLTRLTRKDILTIAQRQPILQQSFDAQFSNSLNGLNGVFCLRGEIEMPHENAAASDYCKHWNFHQIFTNYSLNWNPDSFTKTTPSAQPFPGDHQISKLDFG